MMPLIALSDRSHFHLGELQRVVVATPSVPFDAVSVAIQVPAVEVESVEIGFMTCTVPPTAFETPCTVDRSLVVVRVERREAHAIVYTHRITYKTDNRHHVTDTSSVKNVPGKS